MYHGEVITATLCSSCSGVYRCSVDAARRWRSELRSAVVSGMVAMSSKMALSSSICACV